MDVRKVQEMKQIGFVGLGLMGAPMAANIARAGYPLIIYNRTASKAETLQALGAKLAESPRAVAQASEVVVTMLSEAKAVEEVLSGENGLILQNAHTLGASLPASSVIHQLFTAAKERGYAEEDSSAVYRVLAELSGLS